MEWRGIFHGRRQRGSMRSCMRPREPLVDCLEARDSPKKPQPEFRHRRRVRERLFETRKNRLKVRSKRLKDRGKPGARGNRSLRLRRSPPRRQGRPHETKSLLEHLIDLNKEREAAAGVGRRRGQKKREDNRIRQEPERNL